MTKCTPKPTRGVLVNEVIEIIDDVPRQNKLKPGIVEYINLDDSDDEDISKPVAKTTNNSVISINDSINTSVEIIDTKKITKNKSKLPREKEKNRLECPVCLENLKNKQLISTICGHVFCKPCADNVIKTTKACPTCRKKLTSKRIHPLYL